jgi:hypothetical protein
MIRTRGRVREVETGFPSPQALRVCAKTMRDQQGFVPGLKTLP